MSDNFYGDGNRYRGFGDEPKTITVKVKQMEYMAAQMDRKIEGSLSENERLRLALEDAKLFAKWVECLGRTDCEIYKHELKSAADLAIERIDAALDV